MAFAETFKALSDPVRRQILELLKKGALSAGEIASHFDMTGATISYHLKILKQADLDQATARLEEQQLLLSSQASRIDDLVGMVDIKKGLKVVIDCASGAGSEISPLVFRKAGCEVTTLNSQPDGFFPGRNPEPNAENLQTLMKTVVAIGADLGIAHDGDADRMITVDENGDISPFDSLLALISKEFEGDIVTTVDAGLCMDESVNGEVLRTPVGDVNVAEVIIEKNASFGGEPSGTWLHPDFCMCPDGILSGLRMAEIVSRDGKLSELLSEIPSYPNIREKITCSKEAKVKVMENMEELLNDAFDDIVDVNSIDGVRITFEDDSWVLVRPSGTEDYIRITLESRDQKRADFIKEKCVEIINENL